MNSIPHYHPVFTTQPIPHLAKLHLQPSEAELQWAKQSLICKHKAASGDQQVLFTNKQQEDETVSTSAKNLIETQRKKFAEYLRKNYADKINPELMGLQQLRKRMKQVEEKENQLKKQAEQDLLKPSKKRVQMNEPAKAGRKQKKTEKEEPTKGKNAKKGAKKSEKTKKQAEKVDQEEAVSPEEREVEQDLESLSVENFDNDMYDGDDDLDMGDD